MEKAKLVLEDAYGLDEFVCSVLQSAYSSFESGNTKTENGNANSENGNAKNESINAKPRDLEEALLLRCQNYCYPKRLRKVFEYAKANGYDAVSTTLLYSIYQQHDIIKDLMEHLAKEFGIEFLYRDFREGWQEGQDEARRIGLYMQKYCGCVFSEEESMLGREVAREMRKVGISPTNQNVRKIIEKSKHGGEINRDNLRSQVKCLGYKK